MVIPSPHRDPRIENWLKHHFTLEQVREELESEKTAEEESERYVKMYKKELHAIRSRKGFIWMAAGALIGFLSCLLSIANPFPDLYEVILYGLTSVSIMVIFVGLYFFFE